jgi:RAP1 GTPase activating protein 1
MLPHSKSDSQQVERKRYLGSDIVNIVFQEGYATFQPDALTAAKLRNFYMFAIF